MKLVKNISLAKLIHKSISKYKNQFNIKLNKFDESIDFVEDRKGHDIKYSISNQKLKNSLKWTPKVNLSNGIDKTVKWYLDNYKIWKQKK